MPGKAIGRHSIYGTVIDLAELVGTVLAGSPSDFGKLIAEETEKWGKVIELPVSKRSETALSPRTDFLRASKAVRRGGLVGHPHIP